MWDKEEEGGLGENGAGEVRGGKMAAEARGYFSDTNTGYIKLSKCALGECAPENQRLSDGREREECKGDSG